LSGNFAPSTVYQAAVNLTAKGGFTFAGLGANSFSHSGAERITNPAGSGAAMTVTIVFPATGTAMVNERNLTALVTAPKRDETPVTAAISAAQYAGAITWNPADASFAPSTAYQAELSLTAASGYTFAGLGADSFTHNGAQTVTNPAGSGTAIRVTISFPETAAPGVDTVDDLDLGALVIAPVNWAAPDTTPVSVAQYTGTITWSPADSVFAPSTTYQAELSLTATAGHTFSGVGANSFTYTGAGVTNAAGSGTALTVTISFPATPNPHTIILNPDAGDEAFNQASFTLSGTATQTISVAAGYANPRWFVDGDLKGTTNTITIDAVDYSGSPGAHNLTLIITKNGVSWSKEITFTVE
jgi:hypothetical protein